MTNKEKIKELEERIKFIEDSPTPRRIYPPTPVYPQPFWQVTYPPISVPYCTTTEDRINCDYTTATTTAYC